MPPSHHFPASGSLVSLCPALHLAPLDTHDPMCGKRWERSGSKKGMVAINFAQATFTIIQRDSRLIALTLSPRQACLSILLSRWIARSHLTSPSLAEQKEIWREHVSLNSQIFYSSLLFSFLRSFLFFFLLFLFRKIKRRVRQGYRWPLWCRWWVLFSFNSELQLAGGRQQRLRMSHCVPER